MSKPCAQTSLATDNTPIPCDEFISTECVVHPDALVELSLPEDSTVQDIINAFLNAIINLNNQIGATMPSIISGEVVGTDLILTKSDSTLVVVDVSVLFDDTNLSRIVSGAIVGTDLVFTRDDATDFSIDISSLQGGQLDSVVAGTGISVDNTDPANPIVSSTVIAGGQVDSVTAGAGILVDNTDPANPIVVNSLTPGGQVNSVVAGANVTVDNTDPANPIVSATASGSGIGGSILENQIAFGSSTPNEIEGSADLTWDGNKFLASAGGLGSTTTPFALFELPGVAAEGIYGHVQIHQPGTEGLAGILLSSSREDWSLAARGNVRQGTFRLGRNGDVGASATDTAFEVSQTDFLITAPNVTTAVIDGSTTDRVYVTKEYVEAQGSYSGAATITNFLSANTLTMSLASPTLTINWRRDAKSLFVYGSVELNGYTFSNTSNINCRINITGVPPNVEGNPAEVFSYPLAVNPATKGQGILVSGNGNINSDTGNIFLNFFATALEPFGGITTTNHVITFSGTMLVDI